MLKYAEIVLRKDCTGCESCKASCHNGSLRMQMDARGFLYPYIESDTCVKCGACERACPVAKACVSDDITPIHVLACRSNSDEIINKSSSGGMFSELALSVISDGGAVCGARFDDEFDVVHHVIDKSEDIDTLRGSKYVQSSAGNGMSELRKTTLRGEKGMFIGTPCQVAGMRSLLGAKFSDSCLLVEVACHGVPSPMVFKRYREELESSYNSKIKSVNFRDKKNGWKDYRLTVEFENGEIYSESGHKDPYVSGFVEDFYIRESCFDCKFKRFRSGADITVGDFWGVEQISNNKLLDNRGVSVVCVNTTKGNRSFENISCKLKDITVTTLDLATHKNPCLVKSTKWNKKTKRFYKNLKSMTVADAIHASRKNTFMDKVENCLRYRLGLDK